MESELSESEGVVIAMVRDERNQGQRGATDQRRSGLAVEARLAALALGHG